MRVTVTSGVMYFKFNVAKSDSMLTIKEMIIDELLAVHGKIATLENMRLKIGNDIQSDSLKFDSFFTSKYSSKHLSESLHAGITFLPFPVPDEVSLNLVLHPIDLNLTVFCGCRGVCHGQINVKLNSGKSINDLYNQIADESGLKEPFFDLTHGRYGTLERSDKTLSALDIDSDEYVIILTASKLSPPEREYPVHLRR